MVKTIRTHGIVLLLLLALAAGSASASAPTEYGARAFAMGGAYTGAANDIASLVYNPAGLFGHTFEIALGVGSDSLRELTQFQKVLNQEYDEKLEFGFASMGGMSLGRFGVGVAADGSASVEFDCAGGEMLCSEADYMFQVLFGGGFDGPGLPLLNLADLKLGASVARLEGRKLTHTRVDNGDGTYDGVTVDKRGQGFGVNLGASFKATDIITIGVAAQNLFSSVTWTGTRTEGVYLKSNHKVVGTPTEIGLAKETSSLPRVFRAGIAIRPPALGATLAADVTSEGTVHLGLEKSLFLNALNLRVGQSIAKDQNTTTAGIGFNLGPVHLDIAAGSSDGFKTLGTMIEGSVRF